MESEVPRSTEVRIEVLRIQKWQLNLTCTKMDTAKELIQDLTTYDEKILPNDLWL